MKRILDFGAFVEILPSKEGLVHVSKMAPGFINRPEEVVSLGQKVKVKVVEIDEMGRINLAMYWGPKEVAPTPAFRPAPTFRSRPAFVRRPTGFSRDNYRGGRRDFH